MKIKLAYSSRLLKLCTVSIISLFNVQSFAQHPVVKFDFNDASKQVYNQLSLSDDSKIGLSKKLSNSFPASFDLRSKESGYLIVNENLGTCGLRDQGQCGTCSFFAVIAAIEIASKRKMVSDYNVPTSTFDVNLSESELINRDAYIGLDDNGKLIGRDVADLLKKMINGQWTIPLERYNKYDNHPNSSTCSFSNDISNAPNGGVKVTHAFRLGNWLENPDISTLKSALMHLQGIICGVNIRSDGNFDCLDESDGILGANINHSVCIVGWDDNMYGGSWIVKNSWGSGKNDQYFYMKYGHGKNFIIIDGISFDNPSTFFADIFSGNSTADYLNPSICNNKPLTWCDGTQGIRLGSSSKYTNKTIVAQNVKLCFQSEYRPYDGCYLGAGGYFCDVWRMEFSIPYSGTSIEPFDGFANGKLGSAINNCHDPSPYGCKVLSIDDTKKIATFWTWTFQMYDGVGNRFWFPYPPDDVRIGYREYMVPCTNPQVTMNGNKKNIIPIINLLLND